MRSNVERVHTAGYARAMNKNVVIDAIRERRTVREFTDDPVPRDALERWLEAACWAPNHRLTEPWRFLVLNQDGTARASIGDMARDYAFELGRDLPDAKRNRVADAARDEVLESPAFMYVYALPGDSEEISRENYAAVCCAVQNFQLAAYSEGYAVGWSTGKLTRLPGLRETIGADPEWQMVGALFAGKAVRRPRAQRQEMGNVTSWL